MKINTLLSIAFFLILFASCGKDNTVIEEDNNNAAFKATLEWQPELLDYLEITLDSLPKSMDLEWDKSENPDFNPDEFDAGKGFAVSTIEDGDTTFIIGAVSVEGIDTTIAFFNLWGGFDEPTYNFTSLDLFELVFSGELDDLPDGSVLSYILDPQSELSAGIAFSAFTGDVDYSGSSFEITEYNKEKGELSGIFKLNMSFVATENQESVPILKVNDGKFTGLKMQEYKE